MSCHKTPPQFDIKHLLKSKNMEKCKLLLRMSCVPGSGESTLANMLAKHDSINSVVINHDLIKSCFLDNEISFKKSAELTYNLQWALAGDSLRQGRNVIMDSSTCNHQETLDQGTVLARRHGYGYAYIECVMSIKDIGLLEQKLRDRVALRSQRTIIDVEPRDADATNSSSDGSAATHGSTAQ